MNKFVVAINGLKYSEVTAQYAIELAKESNAHLVAVFLSNVRFHNYDVYELVNKGHLSTAEKDVFVEKEFEVKEKSVLEFENACKQSGIKYSIHQRRHVPLDELLKESMYADLLIVNAEETLVHYSEDAPTTFLRSLLPAVQCPVLVVPSIYRPIQDVVFLYDGSPASTYAIRSFTHANILARFNLEVVTVKTSASILSGKRLLSELLKNHTSNLTFTSLAGDTESELVKYLSNKKEYPLVVLGAYKRSFLSMWLKKSLADALMKSLPLPLFIAHN